VADETIPRPVELLLVEDSPTDAWLMQEALRHAKLPNNVHGDTHWEHAILLTADQRTPPRPFDLGS
jgi:hypothetical protein